MPRVKEFDDQGKEYYKWVSLSKEELEKMHSLR